MNSKNCEEIAPKLVDYADGELPATESAVVAEHVAACAHCRRTLAALQKSIDLAGVIWQAGESDLAEQGVAQASRLCNTGPDAPGVPHRFRLRRPALIAASILLLFTGSLIWHFLPQSGVPQHELTLAELERVVNRAGVASQLLAAAEYLAEQPGGEEIARERFHYIVTAYPETKAATQARSRLQPSSQRSI